MRTTALVFVAAIAAQPVYAQDAAEGIPPATPAPSATPAPPFRPGVRRPGQPENGQRAVPAQPIQTPPPSTNRPAIAPQRTITPQRPPQTCPTEPRPVQPIETKDAARRSTGVMMNFDRRDLVEVIQCGPNYTQRNFIPPARGSGTA